MGNVNTLIEEVGTSYKKRGRSFFGGKMHKEERSSVHIKCVRDDDDNDDDDESDLLSTTIHTK